MNNRLLFLLGYGFTYSKAGVIYAGDVLNCLRFSNLRKLKQASVVIPSGIMLLLLAFPLLNILSDLFANSNPETIAKGIFRSAVFLLAIGSGLRFAYEKGIKYSLSIYAFVCVSCFMWGYFFDEVHPYDVEYINKYYFVAPGLGVAIMVFIEKDLLRLPLLLALSAMEVFLNSRGDGAMIAVAAGVVIIVRVQSKFLKSVLILCCLGALAVVGLRFASSYNKIEHQDASSYGSDFTRYDMAVHAWNGYLEKPFLGRGTGSHQRDYISPLDTNESVGVHSWLLQFAYELGSFSFIFCAGLLWICWRSILLTLLDPTSRHAFGVRLGVAYVAAKFSYDIFMSPFYGFQKHIHGYSLAILLVYLYSRRVGMPASQRQNAMISSSVA